jgi:Chalcone isomerase-like
MRALHLVVALVVGLAAAPATGREVAGVTVPETVGVSGQVLRLNGAGLRTRFFFKVYVIGLYLSAPVRTAEDVSDGPRRVTLFVLRDLEGSEIAGAIGEAFARNAGDALPRLEERLTRFEAMFPAVHPGDRIDLTVEGDRTTVVVQDEPRGTIEGADFARALLAVWLGPNPVDADLKRALLGG